MSEKLCFVHYLRNAVLTSEKTPKIQGLIFYLPPRYAIKAYNQYKHQQQQQLDRCERQKQEQVAKEQSYKMKSEQHAEQHKKEKYKNNVEF